MVTCISGIPGSGKNVRATYLAKKHFKKENSLLRKFIRKLTHQQLTVNNVYSTYPILLRKYRKNSKKKDIYSNKVTLYDLVPNNKFKKNALIIIDETQAFYDSEDYKDFPREIAIFNQFHRHFDVKDIYYISQHPSRILKKLCILASEFDKIKNFVVIPFVNIAFMHIVVYYERDDYGKYYHPKKEVKSYDVKNKYCLFFTRSVFKSYSSKYLKVLNVNSSVYDKGTFESLSLSNQDIKFIYRDRI